MDHWDTKNTGECKQQVRSMIVGTRAAERGQILQWFSSVGFTLATFSSYFSMIVFFFCTLCFSLLPCTEHLQFSHFPSLSRTSGFSLTTPISRLVSAISQEFAITWRKKKKPTTPKQTDMPMVLFSIIVPCYRHAIHHAIHQWPTRSLPRCVYVYMMQINCFFMLNSALWCWHHQSPTLKTAYSDTENKRMTIVFKNLVSNFKSNCKASLMFYFFSNKIFKHCTQAPSLLWEVTGLFICGCRFPRGHCSSLTWPWPDHRPLFV